jgi:hypothetical protein
MKENGNIENELTEYQSTDATYITLPPLVREEIWKSTGLGSGSLVWRNQIFDCNTHNALETAFTSLIVVQATTLPSLQRLQYPVG